MLTNIQTRQQVILQCILKKVQFILLNILINQQLILENTLLKVVLICASTRLIRHKSTVSIAWEEFISLRYHYGR